MLSILFFVFVDMVNARCAVKFQHQPLYAFATCMYVDPPPKHTRWYQGLQSSQLSNLSARWDI